MLCARCNADNREGRRFCADCGATLPGPCPSCGFANEEGERFCGGCGVQLHGTGPPPDLPSGAEVPARPAAPNERRQVTIVFADMCSFTRLSTSLDPEDTHAVVQRFFNTADAIIESFGGTVDKHIGDAVMGLFGAPIAHGDDPLRAVRAATKIHQAVAALSQRGPHPFSVHIGIASGEVIAGGIASSGRSEYTVIGDSVNLAARLQAQATSGETLISKAVYNAVSGTVRCEPVTAFDPGGSGDELTSWRVLAIDNQAVRPQSPIVGRESELRHFESVARLSKGSGRGEAILLRGDAGIGKTRLVEEFREIAQVNGFRHHGAQVLDFGAGEGQDAIRVLLRSLLSLGVAEGFEQRNQALAAAVDRGLVEPDQEVFLYDLLKLPLPPRLRGLYEAMDNATRFEGKKLVLAGLLAAISAGAPLLMTIEDLHWAQPVTLDYVLGLLEAIVDCPVVLVMTTRAEGDPIGKAWGAGLRGVSLVTINLAPLRRSESERLAAQFVDQSSQYVAECIDRADGNPLFLEQLLRHAEERRGASIPATIQSLVLSRMDRLDPSDREALQAASTIGQRFSPESLCHVLGWPRLDCSNLLESQLICKDDNGYRFTHSLIREGAYSSMLHSRARVLHRRAAEFFRDDDPILCAEHLDKSGDPEAASAYLVAARLEHANYHFMQARLLVERALAIVDDAGTAFELHCAHGEFLRHLGESGASVAAYQRALAGAASDQQRCRAYIGMVEGMRDGQHLDEAMALLDRAETAATRLGLVEDLAQIHGQRGNLFFPIGRVEACLEQQNLSLRYAKRTSSPALEARALSGIADAEYARGRMQTAHRHFSQCVDLCRTHGFASIETPNLALRGLTNFYCANPRACVDDCEAAIRTAAGAKQQRAELVARTAAAPAQIEILDLDEARRHCRRAMEVIERLGARRFLPECLSFLARISMIEGSQAEAYGFAKQAVEVSMESDAGRGFTGPWALGTLAVVTPDPEERGLALSQGEAILAEGCVSHNYLWFHRDAIEVTLLTGQWGAALDHADALEAFTKPEPLGWSGLYVALAQCVAAAALTGWTQSLHDELDAVQRRSGQAGLAMIQRLAGSLERAG